MLYPGTSLTDNCCNSTVEIDNNLSYHVSWYEPDLGSDVVLQIWQSLGIVVIDPFLEVSAEEVVTFVQVRGMRWPREVGATRGESITRKISAKGFQRSVWTMEWCSILLVDNCMQIYSPSPPPCKNEQSLSTVTRCSLSPSKKYGPMMPFRPMAHHTVTASWLRGWWVCLWGCIWAQKCISCLLMYPFKWQRASSLTKIKSNKPGIFSILWLISSQSVSCSALLWPVCLCKIWIL